MKRVRRKLDVKNTFQFDEELELTIYRYVCNKMITYGKWKKIRNRYSNIQSYTEWKKYIVGRYDKYKKESLIEFQRYLNYKINTKKSANSFATTVWCTVMLSTIVSMAFNFLISETDWFEILFKSIMIVIFLPLILKSTYKIVAEDNCACNMYEDYKEIIDELIANK